MTPRFQELDLSPSLAHACRHLWMAIQVWIPDPMGMGMKIIFYPRVAPVLNPNQDGYVTDIFSHPRVT
jgi:hypothetical protein